MKTKIIFSILIIVVFAIMNMSFHSEESGLCDSPVVGDHSGAPGETNCTYCHAGTINTGPGYLEFHIGNDSTYIPGQTYLCNIKMGQDSINKFGFVNLALQNSDSTTIGTFNLIDSVRTRKYTLGGRNYFSHTPCGADADTVGKNEWNYSWTAPSTDVGNITLYISGLAANHNHATTGDKTYTQQITLTPQLANGISEVESPNQISFAPNPANNELNVFIDNNNSESAEIKIFDVSGKIISETKLENQRYILLNTSAFCNGIYFMQTEIRSKVSQRKFWVTH